MPSDPLSDILNLSNARCLTSGTLIAGGDWAHRFEHSETVKFCAAMRGGCWLVVNDDSAPRRFVAGDVVITNGARALTMASALDLLPTASSTPLASDEHGIRRLGTGSDFEMIAGLVAVDARRAALLINILPPFIHVHDQDGAAAKLSSLIEFLAQETFEHRPGAEVFKSQLPKLMVVEALRLHMASQGGEKTAWSRALTDDQIARALHSIHAEPGYPWTLEALARVCAMSRTSFAVRFRAMVGVPPLTYVLNWRMRLAERDLSETARSIAAIVWSLGYASESAFSNAFSRILGMSPGKYRKATRQIECVLET
ncbi:AraC family transcriptional regulator [Sphingomonas sp.]|uniref:AraC family transcriptional regulator n=1 Tax=Sphingomonas sp. TaxID=28214 RepID=UPI003D6D9A85